MFRHLALLALFSLRAQDSELSDSERLRALENDMRQLKQRNAELATNVSLRRRA